jgi:hypothetical protein
MMVGKLLDQLKKLLLVAPDHQSVQGKQLTLSFVVLHPLFRLWKRFPPLPLSLPIDSAGYQTF